MSYSKRKKGGTKKSSSSDYDYDYGDFYGYGGGIYRETTIGFKTGQSVQKSTGSYWWDRSSYSSKWFTETSSRERIKPQLSYWLKRDNEDEFLDTLEMYCTVLQEKFNAGYRVEEILLYNALNTLGQTLRQNRYGTNSVDYVMLYDIFKLHYYTLKELNFTETTSPYMKLILKFLDPYADAGGKGFSIRNRALRQASFDFLRVLVSIILKEISDLNLDPGMGMDEFEQNQQIQDFLKGMGSKQVAQDKLDSLIDDDFLQKADLNIEEIEANSSSGLLHIDSVFKELSDLVNDSETDSFFKKILDEAALEGLDASSERYLRDLENTVSRAIASNGSKAGKESNLKKTAARKLESLKVNHKKLGSLMNSLTNTMEQNGGIVTKRIQHSIYDSDTLDCMLEIENLSPMLKKITNFDPEVEEVFKKGTVDFYLDISGSMQQSQIDSGLSMILQLHSLGYLGNIYLFESQLIYVGKNLDLLPFVTSCGGTNFAKVYHNIQKRGKTSIIYTDGQDYMHNYDSNIYFVGCKGSRFNNINMQYITDSKALFYDIRNGNFEKAARHSLNYPFG